MKFVLVLIAVIGMAMAENTIEQDLEKLYNAMETNDADKTVSKNEFVKYFMAFDGKDGEKADGKLSENDLKNGLDLTPRVEQALWEELNNNRETGDKYITEDELEADFDEFDTNDDGQLNKEELIEAIVLGMIFEDIDVEEDEKDRVTEKEWETYFKAMEKNGQPGIQWEEMKEHLKEYPERVVRKFYDELNDNEKDDKAITDDEIKRNYKAFNADDKDGLTVEEFRNAVSNGPIGQIFAKLDRNGDRLLDAKEIVAALNHDNQGDTTTTDAKNALADIKPDSLVQKFIDALNTDANKEVINDSEVQKFIDDHDDPKNPDHKLNWVEFEKALTPFLPK